MDIKKSVIKYISVSNYGKWKINKKVTWYFCTKNKARLFVSEHLKNQQKYFLTFSLIITQIDLCFQFSLTFQKTVDLLWRFEADNAENFEN